MFGVDKPDLCDVLNLDVPQLSGDGACDISGSTCTVTALAIGAACVSERCLVECADCDDITDLAVDLSNMALSDDACDACESITGVFTLPQIADCVWRYCDPDALCQANYCVNYSPPQPNPLLIDHHLTISVFIQNQFAFNQQRWGVLVSITSTYAGIFVGPDPCKHFDRSDQSWTYFSDYWDLDLAQNCHHFEDGNGKTELTLSSTGDGCTFLSWEAMCAGTPAATIEIWDANA